MLFAAPSYIHNIDPVIGTLLGFHLWWYGLSYSVGFATAHLFIRYQRALLELALLEVNSLSLLLAIGVLLGGRFVEVFFYEWPFYREHLELLPAFWLGGMATHGLLMGGMLGVWLFCWLHRKPFLKITDALAIPAALILACGRLGNFVDGQIVGSVTSVWWAVKFPDAEGFRHPVVLYDGLKNALIIPVLYWLSQRALPFGVKTGVFLFLYAAIRIAVDMFRDYPTRVLGLATGQILNILMSVLGLLIVVLSLRQQKKLTITKITHFYSESSSAQINWRITLFIMILAFALVIPSDWTQDIPARYGKRHKGISYSLVYPKINTAPLSSKVQQSIPTAP